MHIHITLVPPNFFYQMEALQVHRGPDEAQVARAKELTEDLLIVVKQEHAKSRQAMMEQQMQLQQAQAQYAAYSAYNVRPVTFQCRAVFNFISRYFRAMRHPHPPMLLLRLPLLMPHHRHHQKTVLLLHLLARPPQVHPQRPELLPLLQLNRLRLNTPLIGSLVHSSSALQYIYFAIPGNHRAAYGYDVNSEAFKEWQAQQQQQYAAYYAAQGYPVAATADPASAIAGTNPLPPAAAPPSNDPPPPPPA